MGPQPSFSHIHEDPPAWTCGWVTPPTASSAASCRATAAWRANLRSWQWTPSTWTEEPCWRSTGPTGSLCWRSWTSPRSPGPGQPQELHREAGPVHQGHHRSVGPVRQHSSGIQGPDVPGRSCPAPRLPGGDRDFPEPSPAAPGRRAVVR